MKTKINIIHTDIKCSLSNSEMKDGRDDKNGKQCNAPAAATCRTKVGSKVSKSPCGLVSVKFWYWSNQNRLSFLVKSYGKLIICLKNQVVFSIYVQHYVFNVIKFFNLVENYWCALTEMHLCSSICLTVSKSCCLLSFCWASKLTKMALKVILLSATSFSRRK